MNRYRYARALPVIALIIAGGVLYGLQVDRWHSGSEALEQAVERLNKVPMVIGSWVGEPLAVEEPGVFERSGVKAYWQRRYIHRGDGSSVDAVLVVGRPGPISVHTPDICFRGSGFAAAGVQRRTSIPSAGDCWTCRFLPGESSATHAMEVHWTWSTDGTWTAPDTPRVAFARRPVLIKLYVLREILGATAAEKANPATAFLSTAMPSITYAIFSNNRG